MSGPIYPVGGLEPDGYHRPLVPQHIHDALVAKIEEPGPLESAFPTIFEHTITREEMEATENVRKAFRDLEKALWAEDARMRSEVLPSPPEGYRWVSDLVVSDDLISAGVRVRLQYHLEVTP